MTPTNHRKSLGNRLFQYRGLLPVPVLMVALWVVYHSPPDHTPAWEVACVSISVLGLFLRGYTVGHTPKNTSGRNTGRQLADELNTTGSYSLVRHPLYLGNLLMWLGLILWVSNLWFGVVALLFFGWVYDQIRRTEEAFLLQKFGKAYSDWAQSVPVFIPRLSGFRVPARPFSLAKMLRKEKNGVVAIVLCFFALQVTWHFAVGGSDAARDFAICSSWSVALGASMLYYLLVKVWMKWRV